MFKSFLKYINPFTDFSSSEMPLNPITLTFPRRFEMRYLNHYFISSIKQVRLAIIIAIILYGLSSFIIDPIMFPKLMLEFLFIKFAFLLPLALFGLWLTFTSFIKRYLQITIFILMLFASMGVIYMIIRTNDNNIYFYGLITISIYGYIFYKARLLWAILTNIFIALLYFFVILLFSTLPHLELLSNIYFLFYINLIGVFACYSIEYYNRRNFYLRYMLSCEKDKVHKSNIELEQIIKSRTIDLENKNQRLISEIVERNNTEKSLRKSEEMYSTLLNSMQDGVFIIKNLKVVFVNDSFIKIGGYDPSEVIGSDFRNFVAPEFVHIVFQRHEARKNDIAVPNNYEFSLLHRDGKSRIYVVMNVGITKIDNEQVIIGTFKNITERKKAEERRKQLEDQLYKAEKLKTIGTLAGGFAHDFNNILATIQGHTDMAIEDTPEETKVHYYLSSAKKSINKAKEIIKNILTFSRDEKPELKIVSINNIIEDVFEYIKTNCPSNVIIRKEIKDDCGNIFADRIQIFQVLMNLCKNAFQSMSKDGGEIEITIDKVIIDPELARIHPNLKKEEPYIKLSVKDNGHGMDNETIERIYEPFFTTKKVGEGTGLGLSVVHGIVKAHNGEITIESQLGVGSIFNVYLPTHNVS